MKKKYRSSLSFDKADMFRASLKVGLAGVSMPLDYKQEMDKEIDLFKSMGQFGMFGSGNNMNTFYPGVSIAKDIMPKPEDFVNVPFRLLTATTVGAGTWKATDFSNAAVLKASTNMLLEKPIYYDHDTELPNWVGIIKAVKWSESFTNSDGTFVPAGIDGTLAIDAKTNPKIARGVLIGSIFSNSVTVVFDWVPSHTFETIDQFYNQIGNIGPDGKMVTRVVTEIQDYFETSLVWLGADPFAKLIDEQGNLKNIDKSSINYSKESDDVKNTYEKDKKYFVTFGFDKNVLALSKRKVETSENILTMKKELLAALAVLLGTTEDAITVESLSKLKLADPTAEAINTANASLASAVTPALTAFAAEQKLAGPITDHVDFFKKNTFIDVTALATLKTDAGKVVQLEADKTALTTEVGTLKSEKAELAADATIGKTFVSMKRAEVKRLYTVHVGGAEKADAAVLGLIDTAKEDGLEGLLKQYCKDATSKFSGACKACGSAEFEFKSTVSTQGAAVSVEASSVSFEAIHAKFDKSSMNLLGLKTEENKK